MSTTTDTNGAADANERVNGNTNGHVNGAGKGSFAGRDDYAPDDFVTIRVRYKNRVRFNRWYEGQYPDVAQRPARDEWVDDVFALGLDRIEELMPPQMSARARLAAALGQAS